MWFLVTDHGLPLLRGNITTLYPTILNFDLDLGMKLDFVVVVVV